MTLDSIIQVAREVGFTIKVEDVDKFERFAALVAAAEREACAKVCEEQADSPALTSIEQYRAKFIADAIRAR
jgi:hypothetical protein